MSLISAITSRGHNRSMIKEKGGVNAYVFIEFLKRLIAATHSERSFSLSIVDPRIARRRRKLSLKLWAANCGCFFCLPIRPTAIQMSLCGSI